MEHQKRVRVIIIGADHHNTLAVLRCCGLKKCHYDILVHTDQADAIGISHSKFAKNRVFAVLPDENAIACWLLNKAVAMYNEKPVLIPCSDLAALAIDRHWEELNTYYVMPGFREQPGRVAYLMDKMEQKRLSDQYGILMANSWSIDVKENVELPSGLTLPCIIKPEISATGRKADIVVCKTDSEFVEAINKLMMLGYSRVIVQQFLKKKYEICSFGAILTDQNYDGVTVKKLRETPPPAQGSTLLAEFIDDPEINSHVDRVNKMLVTEGFHGLYDIEMLVCEDGVYLNEINFRSSGCGFGMIEGKMALVYEWALAETENNYLLHMQKPIGRRIQNDLGDLHARRKNNITLLDWLAAFFRVNSHAFFFIKDIPGTFFYYKRLLRRR